MSGWKEWIQHSAAWDEMTDKLNDLCEAVEESGYDSDQAQKLYNDTCTAIIELIDAVRIHGVPTSHPMGEDT